MIGWLKLTDDQRKAVINNVEQETGMTAVAVEKDWWVTIVLKALFQGQYAEHMIFKGGTSLSKGWGMIARFSEDIDIALDPIVLSLEYIKKPSKGFVQKLKRAGCKFTSVELKASLEAELKKLGIEDGTLEIISADIPDDRPDTDPQTLYIRYQSLYAPIDYIKAEVKVEVSVRSLLSPNDDVSIESIIHKQKPNDAYKETPFRIKATSPYKTLIEKIFLLHEEFSKETDEIRTYRMSRHLYDIVNLAEKGYLDEMLKDNELYEQIIEHRRGYSRISWVDYDTLSRPKISFIPPKEVMEDFRKDYESMREQMIYEGTIEFDELIEKLSAIQEKIRK